jgi:bidirectional [NiFe] hydrogenase diaphorase subunit
MGTACYVRGANGLLAALEQRGKLHAGETTPDGEMSLLTARCLGACGIAPALVFDGAIAGHQTAELALARVEGWLDHGAR